MALPTFRVMVTFLHKNNPIPKIEGFIVFIVPDSALLYMVIEKCTI